MIDFATIEQACEGNDTALQVVLLYYKPYIYKLASVNGYLEEEAVSAMACKLLTAIPKFRGRDVTV